MSAERAGKLRPVKDVEGNGAQKPPAGGFDTFNDMVADLLAADRARLGRPALGCPRPRRHRLARARAARRGNCAVERDRARARPSPRVAVHRPRGGARLARRCRADPVAHARARRRDPGDPRRRSTAGRDRRPGEHPRDRRAAARDAGTRSRSSSAAARTSSVELDRLSRQSEVIETQSVSRRDRDRLRGRGRPRGRTTASRTPARQARQLDHHAGRRRRRQRHPLRATGGRARRPGARRRRAHRADQDPEAEWPAASRRG